MHYSYSHHFFKTYRQMLRDGIVPSTDASTYFGITNDYVTRLCRQKKVEGILVGRLWFVSKKSLEEYLQQTRLKREEQHKRLSQQLIQEYQQRSFSVKPA